MILRTRMSRLRGDIDDVKSMITQGIAVYSEKVKLDAYRDAFTQANFNMLEELKTKMGKKFIDLFRDCDEFNEVFSKGEVKAKTENILSLLKIRFKSVAKDVEEAVLSYSDLTALDSLFQCAAVCGSVEEFKDSLTK